MSKTMDIIKASEALDRLYNLADIMDHVETDRVIEVLDKPNLIMAGTFWNVDPAAEIRHELVCIVKANALLRGLTKDGAIALKRLLDKTASSLIVPGNVWNVLTEDERIVRGYDIDRLWSSIHHEDLGSNANTNNLFAPYFGDNMP